jgi:type VI secretion system protein ImpH
MSARSLIQTLRDEPDRFDFDAAVAVAMRAGGADRPGDAIRFHATTGLGFVPSDVAAVERIGPRFRLTTGLLGLSGPSGVLPRPFTDLVNTERRRRSPALAAFLDLLAQRPLANFAMAGIKYRVHRAAARPATDGLQQMALALTGYASPHLASRLPTGTAPVLFYAGLFAAYPRSADRLGGMLSDWLGRPVEVEEFDGTWLELGPSERSTLPVAGQAGRFNTLGVDAAIGSRSWDLQSRIRLRIGPLSLEQFDALMPDRPLFHRLAGLVRAYLGGETRFAINPILAADAVPRPTIGTGARSRLGWNGWLPVNPRRCDGTEAIFEADGTAPAEAAAGARKPRRSRASSQGRN